MADLGTQHADMFAFGDEGSTFSLDGMRRAATLRLKDGWTTTVHHHTYAEDCAGFDCEHYEPERTDK